MSDEEIKIQYSIEQIDDRITESCNANTICFLRANIEAQTITDQQFNDLLCINRWAYKKMRAILHPLTNEQKGEE